MNTAFNNQRHGFHLVTPSVWPLFAAIAALAITYNGAGYMHGYAVYGDTYLPRKILYFIALLWWRDVLREANQEGQHTRQVQKGLKMGMILFIVSEIMFFFAFFWAFFHSSFNPSQTIGGVWPPMYLTILNPWELPFLNTLLLLTSGAFLTVAHLCIVEGEDRKEMFLYMSIACAFGYLFTMFQHYEYSHAPFSINDGVYGSVFYMATGFHGIHVCIGGLFLLYCSYRIYPYAHFTRQHHIGFEAAAWYWHFVDVVWLFLFTAIYWWGS